MKQGKCSPIGYLLAILFVLGMAGCERPVKKGVEEWKAEGNVEQLLNALGDARRKTRIMAAQALGELEAEQAVEPLAALLTSPDPQLAVAAIGALISIGTEPAEIHLITALELEDSWARTTAINGLGALKSTHAVDSLAKALNTVDDDRVSTAAAVALGLIGDEKSITPLATKIDSPSYPLRLACVKSIGNIGGQEAARTLVLLMGDNHSDIRKIAVDSLIASGKFAAPYALDALHGKNAKARQSAVTILKGIDAVPSVGKPRMFYLIAQIPPQTKKIDSAIVLQLAETGESAVGILLKAVAHESVGIREHAFRALEAIGKPCVAQAIEAVEKKASPAGKQWFSERIFWEGAPSWRIDLWAAATALNPDFKRPNINTKSRPTEEHAIQVLTATQHNIPREYIPLLIPLLAPIGVDSSNEKEETETVSLFGSSTRHTRTTIDFREITEQRLIAAGDIASFPLIAATGSSSKKIADSCAKLLRESFNNIEREKRDKI